VSSFSSKARDKAKMVVRGKRKAGGGQTEGSWGGRKVIWPVQKKAQGQTAQEAPAIVGKGKKKSFNRGRRRGGGEGPTLCWTRKEYRRLRKKKKQLDVRLATSPTEEKTTKE